MLHQGPDEGTIQGIAARNRALARVGQGYKYP